MAEQPQPRTDVAPLVCQECRGVWLVSSERWRMYATSDTPPRLVPYCPVCASEEFDDLR